MQAREVTKKLQERYGPPPLPKRERITDVSFSNSDDWYANFNPMRGTRNFNPIWNSIIRDCQDNIGAMEVFKNLTDTFEGKSVMIPGRLLNVILKTDRFETSAYYEIDLPLERG